MLIENSSLKEEIKSLKVKFTALQHQAVPERDSAVVFADDSYSAAYSSAELFYPEAENQVWQLNINGLSEPAEKIKLFMSLFKDRDDVYAKRWENKKKGTSGYSPVCLNEWKSGLCGKPAGTCADCTHKAYAVLDEKVIDDHLRGRDNFVAVLSFGSAEESIMRLESANIANELIKSIGDKL
ncbi:hypothetical protein SCACP_35150 [Sporomusa carbonis]|uniref:TOTE conflict system archaeo-eukaryotic primase domain-containing protein n=1 Tax=Sporomusa carbonis TaxID=3076075 RepID=UPI003A70CFAA